MRCSHCSEVIKPVVAFDGDGTLGDFHRHFLRFLGQYLGVDLMPVGAHYDGQERFREWVCREFHISLATWKQIKLAYRQNSGIKRERVVRVDDYNEACRLIGHSLFNWKKQYGETQPV
jgi:hypothetical protein